MNESQPLRAALWMVGAIMGFTSMAIAGRAVSLDLDTFEIMLYRSLIGIVVVLVVSSLARTRRQISTRSMHLHFIRNISHFTGQNLWFYAITVAPLAQVFGLEFTMPIWAMFLAVFVLKERLTATRIYAALIGFVGIVIIVQPGSGTISPGLFAAAAAAIGFAGSAVFTRLLTRTETVTCILFWLATMQAVFGLIGAGYDGDIAWPASSSWPWIALIGFAGLLAHFCLTRALSLAPATVVMPIDFARLPVIMVVGALLYDEPVRPMVLLGALLIFGGNFMNIRAEARRVRPA